MAATSQTEIAAMAYNLALAQRKSSLNNQAIVGEYRQISTESIQALLDENSALIVDIMKLTQAAKVSKNSSENAAISSNLENKKKMLNRNLMILAKWADESSDAAQPIASTAAATAATAKATTTASGATLVQSKSKEDVEDTKTTEPTGVFQEGGVYRAKVLNESTGTILDMGTFATLNEGLAAFHKKRQEFRELRLKEEEEKEMEEENEDGKDEKDGKNGKNESETKAEREPKTLEATSEKIDKEDVATLVKKEEEEVVEKEEKILDTTSALPTHETTNTTTLTSTTATATATRTTSTTTITSSLADESTVEETTHANVDVDEASSSSSPSISSTLEQKAKSDSAP